MTKQRFSQASLVVWVGFAANLLLTLLKMLAGILGRSSAMVADAIHSLSDIVTDLVILGSLRVASKPRDKNHKYGHGKVETLAAAFVGIVLMGVGAGILYSGLTNIYAHYASSPLESPGMVAFYAAIFSIAIKEFLFHYTIRVGKTINSPVVTANAWHHRSDAYSSLATLAGITGAIFLGPQWVVLDPLAAAVVSIFIFKVAYKIIRSALLELIETSLPGIQEEEILRLASNVKGVSNPHNLKTRKIGSAIAIELHIQVHRELNIREAHDITVRLEKCLLERYGEDTHISVHAEPL